MGLLSDQLAIDAQIGFADIDGLAEPITYTPTAVGGGVAISIGAVVFRPEPTTIEEARARVRRVEVFLPRDPAGLLGPAQVQLEDLLTLPWRIGDMPSNFRVKARLTQDPGGWMVVAEQAVG